MKTNIGYVVKDILFGILKFPLTLLKGISILLKNIMKSLRFSIRRKISFSYLMLYVMSCIITLLIVSGGYIYYHYEMVNHDAYDDIIRIQSELENESDFTKILSDIALDRGSNIYITDSKDDILYSNTSTTYFKRFPKTFFDYAKFILDYGRYPDRYYIYIHNNHYNIYFYYDLSESAQELFIIIILLFGGQCFGYLIIWMFGSLKSKKILKPIYQMTKKAKKISIYNMDARLNVNEAKYELKDLAITLNDMLDRLSNDYIKQKRFVSDVSHELRTPISIVNGYANMLQRWGKDDEEVLKESITAIKNESENMKELVEDLLFLARHDNQTLQYNKEKFYLDELLEEVIKETELIDKKHIIEKVIENELGIFGDKNRIKQAIRIFVDNAIKYTPPSGKITIAARKDERNISMSIKDTGIGIDKKDLGNIFNRFYRSDKSRTRQTGGHGLGLSIAKIIILGHSGQIRVRSKIEVGSEFIISLPRVS